MKAKQVLLGGLVNNPVFVLVLGMCPTIAVSKTLSDSFFLGISTMFVLIFSNLLISLFRNIIPDKVRIPSYIIIIATLVTVVDMFLAKFLPPVHKNIGGFIQLITVNCIILARAESFANSNKPTYALLDGVSMGAGFTVSICLLGFIRELLGKGAIFGIQISENFNGVMVIATAAGGFIMLGLLMAAFNAVYGKVLKNMSLKPKNNDSAESGKPGTIGNTEPLAEKGEVLAGELNTEAKV